jgi:hypothetical protein
MTKTVSRTRTSKAVKKKPGGKSPKSASDTSGGGKAAEPVDRQHLLTITEDESHQVYEARCMLRLVEDIALFGEPEVTISRGSLVVMMAAIREKLTFKPRLMPVDAGGILQNRQ